MIRPMQDARRAALHRRMAGKREARHRQTRERCDHFGVRSRRRQQYDKDGDTRKPCRAEGGREGGPLKRVEAAPPRYMPFIGAMGSDAPAP